MCVLFNGKALPTRPDGCLMLDTQHSDRAEEDKFTRMSFNGKALPTRPDGCLMLDTQHSENGANVCVVIRIPIV